MNQIKNHLTGIIIREVIELIKAYGSYKTARDGAWQALIDFNVTALPVSVLTVADQAGISVLKDSDVRELRIGEVGASILDGDLWYIIYDDSVSKDRIRFTIAHELGHIFLGHPLVAGYHARTIDTCKPETETQADIFASRFLAPACVLWALDIHTTEDIMRACNISRQAAKIRAERMGILYERQKFLTSPLERKVYENFKEFIEQNKK